MAGNLRKAALLGNSGSMPPPPVPLKSVIDSVAEHTPHKVTEQPSTSGAAAIPTFFTPGARKASGAKLTSWNAYWDEKKVLDLPSRGGKFVVYVAGPADGPIVLCLHGGGYTGLTWSRNVKHLKEKYRVVAPDLRGHGETITDKDTDFSKETMTDDIVAIWEAISGPVPADKKPPPTVIVGHSMGGGLAVWAAASKRISPLEGVVVIDVVEGTALAALPHMTSVLNSRPGSFKTLDEAIAWALRTGMCRSKEAVGVSLPSQLVKQQHAHAKGDAAAAAAHSAAAQSSSVSSTSASHGAASSSAALPLSGSAATSADAEGPWVWRTPLSESRPYWEGWYTGLSEAFLAVPGPKMLLLAGTDRLDKVLTIGQMQGKFQLVLMPTAGHAIQEDEGDKTAEHLLQFLKRFRIGEPPMQFPKAFGVRPVLPVVAGPVVPPPQAQPPQ